jgi:hypothetical protein
MKIIKIVLGVCLTLGLATANAELVHQFNNPTFSGQGWASQVLTMEQMRQSAQANKASKAAGEKAAAEAAAANTPLARFMNLFTGQVYSQLATQLTNNLFRECAAGGGASCRNGEFMVTETQQIKWAKPDGSNTVTLSVYDGKKDSNGTFVANEKPTQTITVPVSSFNF